MIKVTRTGCIEIPIKQFEDSRGFFTELYKRSEIDFLPMFAQDNLSFSYTNVVRGMHYQKARPQGKLIRVLTGRVLDVALDLRPKSPTFGQWETFILSPKSSAIYIPEGFAHGFWTLADAQFLYKCTTEFSVKYDTGINPLDPFLKFPWMNSLDDIILSQKDKELPLFAQFTPPAEFEFLDIGVGGS
jgi:dTDP-4-dehydrorhamnose 3,5-epimerase